MPNDQCLSIFWCIACMACLVDLTYNKTQDFSLYSLAYNWRTYLNAIELFMENTGAKKKSEIYILDLQCIFLFSHIFLGFQSSFSLIIYYSKALIANPILYFMSTINANVAISSMEKWNMLYKMKNSVYYMKLIFDRRKATESEVDYMSEKLSI